MNFRSPVNQGFNFYHFMMYTSGGSSAWSKTATTDVSEQNVIAKANAYASEAWHSFPQTSGEYGSYGGIHLQQGERNNGKG
jgi:hypothetical protein